jgi:nicotinamide-nucleotide adenylyltransferase
VRGLVVGRFQPFHNGHKALVQAALEQCVNVVVGIGSANGKPSLKNPFSLEERRAMVASVFAKEVADGTVTTIALPDINNPPRYADHVVGLTGPISKVFGNDDATLTLFEDAGLPVVRTGLVDRQRFEASTIRMQLAEGDAAWRKAVPPGVAALLDKWEAGKRLVRLELVA